MKKIVLALSLAAALIKPALADDIHFPTLETVKPDFLFTPTGFDNNDNAQIVVAGNLPNTCHKVGQTDVRVDKKEFKIFLNHQNYVFVGCWCGSVITPYYQEANLGVLPSGRYEIFSYSPQATLESRGYLNVGIAATNAPDDYHYAPVESVEVLPARPGKPYTLVIKGTFNSSCMTMLEVRTKYADGNVIEVLPITDMRDGDSCNPSEKRAFEQKVELKHGLEGKYLIHVRSMSGQAVNRVVDF